MPTPDHPFPSLLVAAVLMAGGSAASAAYPVAGLQPDQRPRGAPVVKAAKPDPNGLFGVTSPIPPNVSSFMKDQGAWHTPFTRPGMVGYYDIRGWHAGKEVVRRPHR